MKLIPFIYVIGSINVIAILLCYKIITDSQAPENSGLAGVIYGAWSVGLGVALTLLSVFCVISEIRKRRFVFRAFVALILSAFPLMLAFYVILSGRS